MNDYNSIRILYHSEIAKKETERKKRLLEIVNTDFLVDLPEPIRNIVVDFKWGYCDRKWFPEAWEEYRKHVLEAGLGGKIKMPGAVFNKYLDKYESKELEKIYATEAMHSEELCEDFLEHHGVKGQKWGVRRYQNEDGSLTEEGMIRYGVDQHGNMTKEGQALYNKDAKSALKSDASKRKKIGAMAGTAIAVTVLTGTYVGGKLLSKHGNQKVSDLGKGMISIAGKKKPDKHGRTHISVGKLLTAAILAGATGKLIAKHINKKKKADQENREKNTEQYLNSIEYQNQINKTRK